MAFQRYTHLFARCDEIVMWNSVAKRNSKNGPHSGKAVLHPRCHERKCNEADRLQLIGSFDPCLRLAGGLKRGRGQDLLKTLMCLLKPVDLIHYQIC